MEAAKQCNEIEHYLSKDFTSLSGGGRETAARAMIKLGGRKQIERRQRNSIEVALMSSNDSKEDSSSVV